MSLIIEEAIQLLWVGDESGTADAMASHIDGRLDVQTVNGQDVDAVLEQLADIDCIVSTDPGDDGLALLRRVRDADPEIPFLFVAEVADREHVTDAFSDGADAYFGVDDDGARDVRLARRIEREVDRYRTQHEVTENRLKASKIVEAAEDVLWMFTPDWSETIFVNQAYERVWGRTTESLRADPSSFLEGVHPDDRERVMEAMEQVSSGNAVDLEIRVNADEGYSRWTWIQGEPVYDGGELVAVTGFTRDITERKAREQKQQAQRDRIDTVINHLPVVMFALDVDGDFILSRGRGLERLDLEPGELNGVSIFEAYADNPEIIDAVRQALDGEAIHATQTVGELVFDTRYQPVFDDDGNVEQVIGVSLDITEQKAYEKQLEESNERLEQFAYVASHDLQEPLRTVSNYIELIADEYGKQFDEEGERLIDVVVTASERMQSMINGLLDYSRVTTRGEEFEAVDTGDVVDSVVNDLELLVAESDSSVTWEELPTIMADGGQIRQVFQNLFTNAVEHSDGGVEIRIRAVEEADRYRFEVTDTGLGIEENRQEKIFRIFKSGTQYQTSGQAKGIGLAICDNIVQRHGGEIWVESEPGEGSTFVFTIPKETDKQEP